MTKKWKKEETEALVSLTRFTPEDIAKKRDSLEAPKLRGCRTCDTGEVTRKRGKYCNSCLEQSKAFTWRYIMQAIKILNTQHGGEDLLTVLNKYGLSA